jgi:dihydropteroate synthase
VRLVAGDHEWDLTTRCLVMGILNRTPDSFYDRGEHWNFDDFLRHAERLVAERADILDVGGVKAGPGEVVGEQEELDRVVPAVAALATRFDVPISVDTWRAEVARQAYGAGAVIGNDISGFADPGYLREAAAAGAAVVATHVRLGPRIPDPEPHYDDVVATVNAFLAERGRRAEEAGIPPERVMVDAGLDLGKTWRQSVILLRASDTLSSLGYVPFLSASNKTFLGRLLDLDVLDRGAATTAAHALGVSLGCRVVRAHDVKATRRACDVISAILEAP